MIQHKYLKGVIIISDINIYLPLNPTYEQIHDLIKSSYQEYLNKNKNMRSDVIHVMK